MRKDHWLLVCAVVQALGAAFTILNYFSITPAWWKAHMAALNVPSLAWLSVIPWSIGTASSAYAFYVVHQNRVASKKGDGRYRQGIISERVDGPILKYQNIEGSEGYFSVGARVLRFQLMNIRNAQCDIETTANNVVARLEYVHAGGDRFIVKQGLWLTKADERDMAIQPEALTSEKFIRTNSAGHLAFLGETQDREFFAPLSPTQVRAINPGRWTIKMSITADNCEPITGEIGLVVLPDKRFEYERPAFRQAES